MKSLSEPEQEIVTNWTRLSNDQRVHLLPHLVVSTPEWQAVEEQKTPSAVTEWLMMMFVRAGLPFWGIRLNTNRGGFPKHR